MSQSISGSMQRLWQASLADRQLTQNEYRDLKSQYLQENPQAHETDAEAALAQFVSHSQNVDTQAADALLARVRQGEAQSVVSLFEPDEASPEPVSKASYRVGVELENAELEDRNGIAVAGRDDLRGQIGRLKMELPLPSQTLNHQYQLLMPQLQKGVENWVKEGFENWQGPDFNDNWADGVRDTENPDSWWNTVHSGLKAAEHGAETLLDWGAQAAEWGADATGLNDTAANHLSQWARNVASGLSFERAERQGQTIVRFRGEASDVPAWLERVMPSPYVKLFENPQILDIVPNPDGNLSLDLFPGNPEIREKATQYLASSLAGHPPDQAELAGSMVHSALNNIEALLAEYGVEAELTQGADGQFEIQPQSLLLKGEQLATVLGPERAAAFQEGELKLSPEHFHLNWSESGLSIELRNVKIAGSSDLAAEPAETTPLRSGLSIEQGRADLEVGADGQLQSLSVRDLVAQIEGQNTLSSEVIETLKSKVLEVLDSLNEKLQRYGLSREQLSALMRQIPTQLFQNLMSSANQGDVAAVAASFGVNGESLSKALNFLREQPLEQVIQDLKAVSDLVGVNTTLTGATRLSLDSFDLTRSDRALVAHLSNLTLTSEAQVETAEGLRSTFRASAHFEGVDAQSAAENEVRLGRSELSAEVTHRDQDSSPLSRATAFISDLRQGGRFVVSSGPRAGYLLDEGPQKIRSRQGLQASTALAELSKAPIEDWLKAAAAPETQATFFEQHEIRYGGYLMQYLQQNILGPSEQGVHLSARLESEGAHWSSAPGNTQIQSPLLQARVRREHDGHSSDVDAAIQAERFATHTDGSAVLEGGRAALGGQIDELNGTSTEFHTALGTQDIAAQNDPQGQAQLHASETELEGRVVSEGAQSPVEGRARLRFADVTANGEEIRGRGGQIPRDGIHIQAEQTEASVSADYLEVVAREEGLTADTRVNWQVRGSNFRTGSNASVAATTTAAIRDGQLSRSSSDDIQGTVNASRRTIHNLLRARPELRSFADYLERHEILKPGQSQIIVHNHAPLVTGQNGEVTSYDISVEAGRMDTHFGRGALSFRTRDDGSVRGRFQLNPNRVLETTLRDQLNQVLRQKMREAGRNPNSLGVLDVQIENGKLSLSMNESRLENLDVSIDPRGNELIVSVDRARIDGAVKRFFANLFGVDPRAEAAGAIRDTMAALGARPTGQRYEISIPTRQIMEQVLGNELAGDVRITPEIRGSQLQLDFVYPPGR